MERDPHQNSNRIHYFTAMHLRKCKKAKPSISPRQPLHSGKHGVGPLNFCCLLSFCCLSTFLHFSENVPGFQRSGICDSVKNWLWLVYVIVLLIHQFLWLMPKSINAQKKDWHIFFYEVQQRCSEFYYKRCSMCAVQIWKRKYQKIVPRSKIL